MEFICFLTTFLITNNLFLTDIVDESNIDKKDKDDKYVGMNYYGYYDENDLIIDEISFTGEGDCKGDYIQISGLKDKQVQNNLNQMIIEAVEQKCNNEIYYHISTEINGNFANILSFSISFDDWNEGNYEELFFNINLNDGSEITFEDIYNHDYNIYADIANELYSHYAEEVLIGDSYYDEEYEDYGYYDKELSDIEDLVFKDIREIKNGNFNFLLSSNYIIISVDDTYLYVPNTPVLAPNLYYMSRYLSEESLFEKLC